MRLLKLLYLLLLISFTSCFTGVEGTKRIDIGRDDRKQTAPTLEESYLADIIALPIKDWQVGKRFEVADDRFSLLAESVDHVSPISDSKGKNIVFTGISTRALPDGTNQAILLFDLLPDKIAIAYPTGREYTQAIQSLTSTQLPMLIDLDILKAVRDRLVGKTLYPLSSLWYDTDGRRVKGIKFNPVTITDVTPGDARFPAIVTFSTQNGDKRLMYMNLGNGGNESRAFATLFSIDNIRNKYKSISTEHWDLICQGNLAKGMTKEECRLALGNPTDVSSGHDYSRTLDIWQYSDGIYLRFADGLLVDFRR